MVEHPRRQADGRILERVQRLRAVRHLLRVAESVLVEEVELIPRVLLLVREAARGWVTELERLRDVVRDRGRHVRVDAEQSHRALQRHLFRDGVPPVAALRHVSLIAQPLHQDDPSSRDADRIPAGRGRRAREPMARERWDHDVEGVPRGGAVSLRVGERADDLQLLDDRPGHPCVTMIGNAPSASSGRG